MQDLKRRLLVELGTGFSQDALTRLANLCSVWLSRAESENAVRADWAKVFVLRDALNSTRDHLASRDPNTGVQARLKGIIRDPLHQIIESLDNADPGIALDAIGDFAAAWQQFSRP